jgi:hypothetical protein
MAEFPSTPDSAAATASATDPTKTTIPKFAEEIRKRWSGYESLSDDALVRNFLTRRPDYIQFIHTAEKRPRLKDRTPSSDQRMQKIFEKHPLVREAALGVASGLGIPESDSKNLVWDMAKGTWQTFTGGPQTKDEYAARAAGLPLPAYRIIKGVVQQTKGYGQEVFDSVDWGRFWKEHDPKNYVGGGVHLKTDETGRQVGAEHLVHGLAGLATLIVSVISGGAKTPEAMERVAEASGKVVATTGKVMERVAEVPGKIADVTTVTAQRAAGTGPKLAKDVASKAVEDVTKHNISESASHTAAVEKHAGEVEKVNAANAANDADYNTKVERINQDFDEKIAKLKTDFATNDIERNKKVAELQGQQAEKIAQARAEWVQKAHAAKQAGREAAKVAGQREALEHGQNAYTKLVDENVKAVHKEVRGSLDQRWNGLRERIGVDAPVKAPPLYNAVESGRGMLAGVPADLKIFNDIVKEITEKDTSVETEGGKLERVPKESIPFDDARTQYSAIGEKAYGAQGNLRRALFTLYDAYDKALSETATAAGQGKEYAALKHDWKSYMDDWHDMGSQATGGSPLARLLKAVDDPIVIKQVSGIFGDRLMQTFARYEKYGASPKLMSKLRDYNTAAKILSRVKVKVPDAPERLSPLAPIKEPPPVAPIEPAVAELEAKRAKTLERTTQDRPEAKPIPAPPPAPDIHPQPTMDVLIEELKKAKKDAAWKAREGALTLKERDKILGGMSLFGWAIGHNIGYAIPYSIAKVGEVMLLRSKVGQEWISKITPQDIRTMQEVLDKVPEHRAEVTKTITDGLIMRAKAGLKLPPLKIFRGLLSEAQLGAIIRVVAPPQGSGQGKNQSAPPAPSASPATMQP